MRARVAKTLGKAKVKTAAERVQAALNRRYEARRYQTQAVVSSVVRDAAGRVTHALATIDGVSGQTVQVDIGAPVAAGDVFLVRNNGAVTLPAWQVVRKLSSVQAVPWTDPDPTLPTPTGLTLTTGHYDPVPGGGVAAWVYASWLIIGDRYGPMRYELQYQTNDGLDPVTVIVNDQRPTTNLAAAVDNSQTVIPRDDELTPYDFPRSGRIQIDDEKIDYTGSTYDGTDSGTGTGGTGTLTDGTKSWTTDEWAGYALVDSAPRTFAITSNTGTVLTVSGGNPATGAYIITPAFTGCTRGAGSTTPAVHADNAGISALSAGAMVNGLPANTDYNFRVRAAAVGGAVSAWTAWASVQTDTDTLAPTVPTGLAVTPGVNAVTLTWSGPVLADVPDLAGFRIYRSAVDGETGAALVGEVAVQYQADVAAVPGRVYYYNLKAFDTSGNVSNYGADWEEGAALMGPGEQMLTNADWERDLDGDGEADGWTEISAGDCDWGAYGRGGGKGYRITPTLALPLPTYGYAAWDPYTTGVLYEVAEGQHFVASVYVKPDATIPAGDLRLGHFYGYTGDVCIFPTVFVTDASGGVSGYTVLNPTQADDTVSVEQVDDGWYRLWLHHEVTASDVAAGPYIGFAAVIWNGTSTEYYSDFDRPMMEESLYPSPWQPGLLPALGTSGAGLRIDQAGIVTQDGQFALGGDGKVYSDVVPDADGTRDLGTDSVRWANVYADNVDAQFTTSGHLAMRPAFVAGQTAAKVKPTPVTLGAFAGYSMPIYNSDDEELFWRLGVPGRWDGASDITYYLVVCLASAEDEGDDFGYQLSWAFTDGTTGAISSSTTDIPTVTQNCGSGHTAQYSVFKLSFTIEWDAPTPDVAAGGVLAGRVRRVASGGTEISGEVIVLDHWLDFVVDKVYKA